MNKKLVWTGKRLEFYKPSNFFGTKLEELDTYYYFGQEDKKTGGYTTSFLYVSSSKSIFKDYKTMSAISKDCAISEMFGYIKCKYSDEYK